MRILVAEDEIDLAEALEDDARNAKYSVEMVHDGEDAFLCESTPYDLLLLDVMMLKKWNRSGQRITFQWDAR